ncbi:MAG TPA: efflux RND transporter periplasmic adaptor subunit [Tepidisphaeraceae bacterium]|nr:efflux RND transporter periplasmic adaptor subunit [Tepidisphaeraceae bacterium]
MKKSVSLLILALSAIGLLTPGLRGDQPDGGPAMPNFGGIPTSNDPHVIVGYGKPSEEHRVSFPTDFSGTPLIAKVLVQEGDHVKAGEALMVEDTEMAYKELDVLAAAAAVTAPIEEAKVEVTIKTQELQNMDKLGSGEVSDVERLDVELDRDQAAAREKEAEQEISEKKTELARQQELIKEMTLTSPVNGIVRKISLYQGEVVQPKDDGAVDIVVNDPLWVEVDTLPASVAGRLKLGDTVQVAFPDAPDHWIDATVCYLDPVVQEGPQYRIVRFTMPNPDNHPAGLAMLVKLPDRVIADADLSSATAK